MNFRKRFGVQPTDRQYEALFAAVRRGAGDPLARMTHFVDTAWSLLSNAGVSWIGFYLPGASPAELVLGPRRDKPACSPIGLHGACGQSFSQRRTLVVRDVRALGAGYIACDPRDQSELVIPLIDPAGACAGVLDVDSFELAAFDESDAMCMNEALVAAGLQARDWVPAITVHG